MALGCAAAWGATSYQGASGIYPLVLGLLLVLLGGGIAARALRHGTPTERVLMEAPVKLFTTIALGVAYVALIVPLGFYTASILLMLGLPLALGFRRIRYALIVGVVFVSLVYLVFSVLLEKPLPREAVLALLGQGG